MTLEEAIEIGETRCKGGVPASLQELEMADDLGIEALKAVIAERTGEIVDYRHPLPGETEE